MRVCVFLDGAHTHLSLSLSLYLSIYLLARVLSQHKIIEEAVREGKPLGKLPPSVNLEAKAGTIMLFEGRVLHGTGANRTPQWRYVVTQANVKPWLRQQENTMLGVRPEVLERASEKLLQRLGFKSQGSMHMEGYGTFGSGRPGDNRGDLRRVRMMIDKGEYRRMGELTSTGQPKRTEHYQRDLTSTEELSLNYLQGPDGEGDVRIKTREFTATIAGRVAAGAQQEAKCGVAKL